jgi:hypothetical protein
MSKGLLSITSDVINGVWNVGTEVYKTVSNEVSQAVVDEAMRRTREHFKDDDIDEKDQRFLRYFLNEKDVVAKEFKSMAVKGGLLVTGLGLFM